MANFKFNDIATILNSVFEMNAENGGTTVSPDLSNIVDFGKAVTDNGFSLATTGDALVNKIREQVLLTTDFVHTGPDCFYSNEDWAGMTEVYRVLVGDFSASKQFDAVTDDAVAGTYYTNGNTFNDLFGKEMPTIKARYFDKAITYRKKITIAPTQFANAFISPSAMSQFINEIGRKVEEQWSWAREQLEYFALAYGVGKTVLSRATASQGTVTKSDNIILKTWTSGKELYQTVKKIMRDLQCYNNKYAAADYVSSVTPDNLVCYMRADLYDKLISEVENFTGNGDVVKSMLGNFKPLPMFGCATNTDSIVFNDGETAACIRNIDYIICDKRLFGCTADHKKITSQYVANEDVTNYFHMATAKYRVNSDLPVVVECDCDTLADVFDTTALD